MIERVSFHSMAEFELNEAAEYYELRVEGLGDSFIFEVERVTKLIQQNPESGLKVFGKIRKKILWRFPYSLLYSVKENSIRIIAIANQKRRPFYWRGRK